MFGDMPQCYWTAHDAMSGTPAEMTIPMSQLHIYCAPTGPNYMQTFSKRFLLWNECVTAVAGQWALDKAKGGSRILPRSPASKTRWDSNLIARCSLFLRKIVSGP